MQAQNKKTGLSALLVFRRLGTNEGLVMVAGPSGALDRYFAAEETRWRKVIEDAGIKIE
jgi:hypothetical protein